MTVVKAIVVVSWIYTRYSRSEWSATYTLLFNSQEDETTCTQMSSTTATEEDDNNNGIRFLAKILLLVNE